MDLPMRVSIEEKCLPEEALPNEIACFFASWVCKNKDGQWWIFSKKPLLNEESGEWVPSMNSDEMQIPNERIIDPGKSWNEGLWGG